MSVSLSSLDAPAKTARAFAIAWACATIFYFLEYAGRSAPAVMIPELSHAFGVDALGVSSILGVYYYTYSSASLVAGVLLDRRGAKYVVPAGMGILGLGCVLFAVPNELAGTVGRLLQGAGSAFAFTGAVYLAAHGFSAQRLATAIGVTQCVGMLGGSLGQLTVGPMIHGVLSAGGFWILLGVLVIATGTVLLLLTPAEQRSASATSGIGNVLTPYRIVFSNPQSYLCGLTAGLLFAPTTIGDMVWGVRLFQEDRGFGYQSAVFAASMVPLGWVIGCPLLGWVADTMKRRKPALIGGAVVMLICGIQLSLAPALVPAWLTLLVIGIASGAAMIPYTIIKEVNPDHVKGSATGGINFITFLVTAILGPVFAFSIGKSLGVAGTDVVAHFRESGMFWVGTVAVALLASLMLRETGHAVAQA
ncbi:MFS transporter [Burkholderia cepacia]|uniref:MFS transporter n=1 Tax=Burkholderia cepacia TaxID=292 RepID=UPI00249F7D81|nr:MFS transporter [Burkholderia cepacia]WGY69287.1 MFS transporter [Burkholderia cepacia]